MRTPGTKTLLTLALALQTSLAGAQENRHRCTEDAMLVFDGSGSMALTGINGMSVPRIVDARNALRQSLPDIAASRKLGLIVYGPSSDGRVDADGCRNVFLHLPPMPQNSAAIMGVLDQLQPNGMTPLTSAVETAARALDHTSKAATIVLLTDGRENCGGPVCRMARTLASEGLSTRIHVIGFRVRTHHIAWKTDRTHSEHHGRNVAQCMADMTGGQYHSTETIDSLADALEETLGCPELG